MLGPKVSRRSGERSSRYRGRQEGEIVAWRLIRYKMFSEQRIMVEGRGKILRETNARKIRLTSKMDKNLVRLERREHEG